MRRAEPGREEACCRMENKCKSCRNWIECRAFRRGGIKGDGEVGVPGWELRRRVGRWEGEAFWFLVKVQLWKPFCPPRRARHMESTVGPGPSLLVLPELWSQAPLENGRPLASAALGQDRELPGTQLG